MTNWLWLFLAFYILVGQPALLGRMLDNCSLYQLAWLNAGIFFIAWIISAICKSSNKKNSNDNKENKVKLTEKSEEKVSRIEDINWVAIVEVEKKEEIVVETHKDEENIEEDIEWQNKDNEELPQAIEKNEEKSKEKTPERPMRETVSIPKIVQPISWHQTPKKRKKNVKWWQRLLLLVTLGLAAIIAISLWEFLEKRSIAIALILWRILHLVIGKLFDIDGFYDLKRLFTNRLYFMLVIAWIGYGFYALQSEDKSFFPSDFTEKVTTYVKNRFETNKEDESETSTWDIIYVFEWTWEVISDINETDVLWNTEDTQIDEWIIEDIHPEIEIQPEITVENQTSTLSPEESKKQVTMWEAIKSLLAWATLSTKTNKTFTYVSKSNELYPYFKTAQEKWMIGTDTDPSKIVSCETYITMKWIREWRNVGNYSKSEIKSAYWNKASELWKLNGCTKWAYVTKGNL